jgi:hypothetical protein
MVEDLRCVLAEDPAQVPRVQCLYLHHVFPDEAVRFKRFVEELSRTGEIVSHERAAMLSREPILDKPYYSISFDDGLQSCLTAARILEDFGVTACFFVCPGVLDHAGDDAFVANWCVERLHRPPARVLTWDEVGSLLEAGHEVGNHTWSHEDLSTLDSTGLNRQITHARSRLVEVLGPMAGRHFAWPYGERRHVSDAALREVKDAGHVTCASAIRGAHRADGRPAKFIHRDHVIFEGPPSDLRWFLRSNVRKGLLASM